MKKIFCLALVSLLALGFTVGCQSNKPAPFNAQKDFEFINLTIEQADEMFGELIWMQDWTNFNGLLYDYYMTREYADIIAGFILENDKIWLTSLYTESPNFTFVREIRVGDHIDDVLAKFPSENNEEHIANDIALEITDLTHRPDLKIILTYGTWGHPPKLMLGHVDGVPANAVFVCGAHSPHDIWTFSLTFDENLRVETMNIFNGTDIDPFSSIPLGNLFHD